MFAKGILILVTAGVVALALLSIRQQRLDVAHEMSVVHERMLEHRRALWDMEREIAERVRPERVREQLGEVEEWRAIPMIASEHDRGERWGTGVGNRP